jgi:hypothetical protein
MFLPSSFFPRLLPLTLFVLNFFPILDMVVGSSSSCFALFVPYLFFSLHCLDYNLFTPGAPLAPGTLWVVEQIPTLVLGQDVTGSNFFSSFFFLLAFLQSLFSHLYAFCLICL